MKEKDIEKLLKKEGNQLAPSSFSMLKAKLVKTDKYLASEIKKEGDEFVPNNYPPIKEEVMAAGGKQQEKKTKFTTPWKIGIGSALAAVTACAIIIPIVSVESTKPLTAEATCEVKLTSNGENVLEASCKVNKDGSVDENEIYAENELAKKLLAGIEVKKYSVDVSNIGSFISDILSFGFETKDRNSDYVIDNNRTYVLEVNTIGEGYYKDGIVNVLSSTFSPDLLAPSGKINSITSKMENVVTKLEEKRYNVVKLFNKLFTKNSTVIGDFISINDFKVSTVKEAEESLNCLRDIFNHLPFESSVDDFQDYLRDLNKKISEIDTSLFGSETTYWNENYWTEYWAK